MPKSRPNFYHDFRRCTGCDRIYWPGTHIGSLFHFTLLLSTKPFPSGHGESLVIRVLDRAQIRLDFADLGFDEVDFHTLIRSAALHLVQPTGGYFCPVLTAEGKLDCAPK